MADGRACLISDDPPFVPAEGSTETIELTAGDADIRVDGNAFFAGPIELQNNMRFMRADEASFDRIGSVFAVQGNVEYRDAETLVRGDSASYNTLTGEFNFDEGLFELHAVPSRGGAGEISLTSDQVLQLKDVSYTTCPNGKDDWMLKAGSIELDHDRGVGTARNARIEFKGVPFLYLPYMTYPLNNERKTGMLVPDAGTSDRRGFQLEAPVYWNLAPSYDATFVPNYMSKRGLQLGTEFRYLTPKNRGELWGDILPDDKVTGKNRYRWIADAQSQLWFGWRATASGEGVSDDRYFEDLTGGQASTSLVNLDRQLDLEYYDRVWSVRLRAQDFQNLLSELPEPDQPYTLLPQLQLVGEWLNGFLGFNYLLDTETTNFEKSEDVVQGWRFHALPELGLPIRYRGVYITPEIGVDYTAYSLDNQPTGQPSSPTRTVPIFSVDTGAVFERFAGKQNHWLVSLEPRAQYVNIPREDQDDLPVFDTITPDLTLVQLFRKNRFVGYDRVGDTDKITLGLTARFLETGDGEERMRATIGGIRYFGSRLVTLPGEEPSIGNDSDYIAEVGVRLFNNWSLRLGYQWDSERSDTAKSDAGVQFKPGPRKVANLSYRYVRGTIEQTDLSFAWPIGDRWNAVGRFNYSLRDDRSLDRFFGLEYETCCWKVRLVGRRYIVNRESESDTSINLQLELKSFTSIGNSADSFLERGILGYEK